MSRGLDATSKVDGYELDSERGRRKATISRTRQVLAVLTASAVTAVVFLMAVDVAASVAGPPSGNWTQTLNEEFSSAGLNTSLWTPGWQHGGISGPVSGQCLSSGNVEQPGNGYLYLWTKKQSNTCEGTHVEYTGGLVESNPADGVAGHVGFQYSYGYVEWSAYVSGTEQHCSSNCLPDWPALWSFPRNEENEIDTMEGLHGNVCHTWHHHVSPVEEIQGCQSGNYYGWHTYGVDWEPGVLKFYYDGARVGSEVSSGYINSSPQYLIMDMVPPGTFGGTLVAPDTLIIDYVRVWQHLPIVTTGAATGKQPLQATLNGTVNSNGTSLSNCHFDYGTATSYGSSAPCSGPESSESATVSLAPGTTYHFRLVATNASGTAYGSDETLTTPGPVEAVTGTATSVQQTEAVLNGTVNPRGYDAKYHFQYGETTAYGASTPEGDAGAGVGPEPEKATVNNLVPGTMYHYRLVATSGGVTSYGLDQTFGTAETSQTVEYKPNGESLVWYVNSSNALAYWLNSGEKWYNGELGGKIAAGTSPAVEYKPNGQTLVYYVNSSTKGVSYWLNYAEGKWSNGEFGGKVAEGTSPAVEYKPNGETLVWYVNSSGAIAYWLNSGESWYSGELGGKVAAGTSPAVEYKPNGQTLVYYVNSSTKGVSYWLNYAEGKWSNGEFGGKVAEGTSPAVEYKPNGETLVWYVNSSGAIAYWLNSGESWYSGELGGKVAAGTSPTTQYKPDGETLVWYVNSSNAVGYWLNVGASWYNGELGGKVASGTNLAMEYKPNGQTLMYYVNSSTKGFWYWLNYAEGKWSNGEL